MPSQVFATYKVYIDWNNNDSFADSLEDVSSAVQSLSWERGFKAPPPEYADSGVCNIQLRDPNDIYNNDNPSSALYGLILPGIKIRISMIVQGSEVVSWTGRLDSVTSTVNETLASRYVTIQAFGILSQFVEGDLNFPLQEDKAIGYLLTQILDSDDFSASDRVIETGQTTISKFWVKNNQTRIDVFHQLQDAELGRILDSKDGKFTFHDRHHIFSGCAIHTTADTKGVITHTTDCISAHSTYGHGYLRMWEPSSVNPLPYVYNSIRANAKTFNHTTDGTVLVTITDAINGVGGKPIKLPSGVATTVWLELATDSEYIGVYQWATAVPPVDYQAGLLIDGVPDATLTANVSCVKTEYGPRLKCVFTNLNGVDVYLLVLKGLGIGIVEGDPIPLKSDDGPQSNKATSQGKYGIKEYPNTSEWITDQQDGQNQIDYIRDVCKTPRKQITFKLYANYDLNHLIEAQTIDVNDRIHIDDSDGTYGLYVNSDFIVDYIVHQVQDKIHTVLITCTEAPLIELIASNTPYDSKIITEKAPPDDIYVNGIDPSSRIIIGGIARKNNANIDKAEIRAKFYSTSIPIYCDLRTPDEGGSFVDDGTTQRIITNWPASYAGTSIQLNSTSKGRWFYAVRLHNTYGWSPWSDGNSVPAYVKDYVDTEGSGGDIGASAISNVSCRLMNGQAIVQATRPATNGKTILSVIYQLLDKSVAGADWFDVDENTGPAITHYDGSAIDHVWDQAAGTITSPSGFGSATAGLLLIDPSNGSFDVQNCQWINLPAGQLSGNVISGIVGIRMNSNPDTAQQWSHVRIKIVEPPWNWNTYGYMGLTGYSEQQFYWNNQQGDKTTAIFTSDPMLLQRLGANIQARAFFQNKYAVSDCGQSTSAAITDTGNPSGATGLALLRHTDDPSIPVGMAKLRWYRDTLNYKNIYIAGFYFSESLPAIGLTQSERAANIGEILEGPGTCTVTEGSKDVVVTRASDSTLIPTGQKPLLMIFTNDADPDDDIDSHALEAQDTNSLTTDSPFGKSGTFTYYVVKPFWPNDTYADCNLGYVEFSVPSQIGGDLESEIWESDLFSDPGSVCVTGFAYNKFGIGTKLTFDVNAIPGPKPIVPATTDVDNPSGLDSVSIQTCITDARVPSGYMAFRFTRDLTNYKSISRVEVVLRPSSPDIPAHGPYKSQRDAYPSDTIATGGNVTIVKENSVINVAMVGSVTTKVFLIFKELGDQGLDWRWITAHDASTIKLDKPFHKSGVFNWAVIEAPWNQNAWELRFDFPNDFITNSVEELVWQTKPVPLYSALALTKAEVWSQNLFGLTQL